MNVLIRDNITPSFTIFSLEVLHLGRIFLEYGFVISHGNRIALLTLAAELF